MTGEEVPQDVLDAAQRGYSMHGAGLTANIVAAAWPAIEKHIRDRTPTGDLHERLREALRQAAHWCDGRCDCEFGDHKVFVVAQVDGRITEIEGTPDALADAVLHVVEAETAALRERIEEVEDQRDQALAWQDTAERQRDEALAAVQRVRDLHQPTKGMGFDCDEDATPGSYGDIDRVCTSCGTADEYGVRWPCPTVAALDQPEETR